MARESNQIGRSPDDLLKYQQFDEREVVYRWSKDWWDGPLNGTISYRDGAYWFEFHCDTDESGNPYYYHVYPLSHEELQLADSWWRERDRLLDRWRPLANARSVEDTPTATEDEIAEEIRMHELQLPNYTERLPVAWFLSGVNASFYGVQVIDGFVLPERR